MTTDARKETGDALPKGQPSTDKPPEPSAQPETYTKEQAEALADQKHSKLDKQVRTLTKDAARTTAAIEAANRRAQAAEDALAEREREADKKELTAAQGDGDALSRYTAKVAAREERVAIKAEREQLEAEKREHASELEDAKSYKTMKLATDIASELNVDATQLLALTDGTEEKMRKAAEILPKLGQSQPSNIPDSGGGTGSAKKLSEMTTKEVEDITDAEYFRRREAGEKI